MYQRKEALINNSVHFAEEEYRQETNVSSSFSPPPGFLNSNMKCLCNTAEERHSESTDIPQQCCLWFNSMGSSFAQDTFH